MTAREEVLLLTHRVPYPPNKGDKIRSWRLLCRLAEQFDVHLGCFIDTPKDKQWREVVRAKCASALFADLDPLWAKARSLAAFPSGGAQSVFYYRDLEMQRWVQAIRQKPLAFEVAFSTPMAAYLQPKHDARPRIVDLCDADSAKWADYANDSKGVTKQLYRREAARLSDYERQVISWADAAMAISKAEAAVLDSGSGEVTWYGNGVDTDYFDPDAVATSATDEAPDVVFVGAMDYRPNVDAVVWFVEKCWPDILRQHPSAHFAIVGANPVKTVLALGEQSGVTVTGRVDDVRPYLCAAKVSVAPLRIARGVQNKVIEAMAMAKPVVATPAAVTGLDFVPNAEYVGAETPTDFSRAVNRILDAPAYGRSLGAAAREKVKADYSWERQLVRLDEIVKTVLRR